MSFGNDERLDPLRRSTIGFLKEVFDQGGSRKLIPAGSGALIELCGIKGILTAAHVLLSLKGNNIGLFTIVKPDRSARPLEFYLDESEIVVIGGSDGGPGGPDIGFARVPHDIEGRLIDENIFYNFDVRNYLSNSDEPALIYNVVLGMIAENSKEIEISTEKRRDEHAITEGFGAISAIPDVDESDRFSFVISHNQSAPAPATYEGLSGGAIWKINNLAGASNRFIYGVSFYQSGADELGRRAIICHGPRWIYRDLSQAICHKFTRSS